MSTLGFECAHCHNRLAVSADWAGKAVRCPKCHQVVVAPTAEVPKTPPPSPPVAVASNPMVVRPKPSAIETDSIFSDPDEGESVISGLVDKRKPVMPQSPSDFEQPTVRVPGIPDHTTPIRPPADAKASIDLFAGTSANVNSPAEVTNPFRKMVDEVLSEAEAQDASDAAEEVTPVESYVEMQFPTSPSRWQKRALLGVSIYAVLVTLAAVWGWTRSPSDKPAQTISKK